MKGQNCRHRYIERCTGEETYRAFLPSLLPIRNIDTEKVRPFLDKANVSLGRLDGASSILPDIHLYTYMYIRKEAVLSSQIEGTQSSLSDLLLYESGDSSIDSIDEAIEISNYVRAINYALEENKELPLSLRLIRNTHKILLENSRGKDKRPGEFRTSQNWIGGTRPGNAVYVPPSQEYLMEYLDNLEKFIYSDTAPLIKVAICHAQFESIHPFLDGNGRIGRLLITLMLCNENIISKPVVHLSLFFKEHRETYYELLQNVRTKNDWDSWVIFFLNGISTVCDKAVKMMRDIFHLFEKDGKKLLSLKIKTNSLFTVYDALKNTPVTTIKHIVEDTNLSEKTILRMLRILEKLDIVTEITNNQRNLRFSYKKYMYILSTGIGD